MIKSSGDLNSCKISHAHSNISDERLDKSVPYCKHRYFDGKDVFTRMLTHLPTYLSSAYKPLQVNAFHFCSQRPQNTNSSPSATCILQPNKHTGIQSPTCHWFRYIGVVVKHILKEEHVYQGIDKETLERNISYLSVRQGRPGGKNGFHCKGESSPEQSGYFGLGTQYHLTLLHAIQEFSSDNAEMQGSDLPHPNTDSMSP